MITEELDYSTITPDGKTISFKVIGFKKKEELIRNHDGKNLPPDKLDFFRRKAYLLNDGRVIYEYDQKRFSYLIPDTAQYKLMLKGEKYWTAGFAVDIRTKELYPSYDLNNDAAKDYLNKQIEVLNKYPIVDGYIAYLQPDSSVAFLRRRAPHLDMYEGYWYPSLKVFDHEYRFLNSDRYLPDTDKL